jgi:hypothetical protein
MPEMSVELRKTCMECWRLAGYCQPAPTMAWGENCEHLKAIGPDIQRKLRKQRQFLTEES